MFKVGDRVRHKFFQLDPFEGTVIESDPCRASVVWDIYKKDGSVFGLYYGNNYLEKVGETTTMDNPFIETVTTKRLKGTINNHKIEGLHSAQVSLNGNLKEISLVIGARNENGYRCYFNKESLGNLLKMLQEVHDLMED